MTAMAQSLRLPIEKYSYSTNATTAIISKIRWNHLAQDAMAIVLETSAPGYALHEVSMKVVQQAGVLVICH